MYRNAFDPVEGRTLELRVGDFFREGLHSDLLVISAWEGFYEPEPGTMIAALKKNCGIDVGKLKLQRALDFTQSNTVRGWVSEELDTVNNPVHWPPDSTTRFKRLAVMESPRAMQQSDDEKGQDSRIPAFLKMFRLLALLPLHNIPCRSVATPLLNTGRQGAQLQQLIPDLMEGIRLGFENVPELRYLVIFDQKKEAIDALNTAIDEHLKRSPIQRSELGIENLSKRHVMDLIKTLESFQKRPDSHKKVEQAAIIEELLFQLKGTQVSLVTLGISARKLIECLVAERTRGLIYEDNLFKRINYLDGSISAWTANSLHTIRIFGNWMAHADTQINEKQPTRKPTTHDLNTMLLSLASVVKDYPWPAKKAKNLPIKRGDKTTTIPAPRPKR